MRDSKTGLRAVPFGKAARALIDALPGERDLDALLFPRYAEGHGTYSLATCWRTVCEDAKLGGLRLHESKLWNEFVARYHYLGYKTLVGAQMRYAVHDRDGWPVAMLGFSTAAWKLAPRDNFIGWTRQKREKNLPFVVDNPRFLILPWINIPNLGSHTRNVKRWRHAEMALRWTAAGLLEAQKTFRRLKAYRQLPILRNALQEHLRKAQADSAIETIMKAA